MEDDILKKEELNGAALLPCREETDVADADAANAADDNIVAGEDVKAAESARPARKRFSGKVAALTACAAAAVIFGIVAAFTKSGLWLAVALLLAAAAIVLAVIVVQGKIKRRNPGRTFLPYWGIVAEVACVPLFMLGMSLFSVFQAAALLIVIAAVACPVFGLAAGISAVARGKKNVGTTGFALGIVDIIIPALGIVALLIVILLASTGVIIITLM